MFSRENRMTNTPQWFGETSDDLLDCPRKAELGVGVPAESRLKLVRDMNGEWREDGTCSWCGSLKPSTFFQALEGGVTYGATDKSYKAYLHGPEAPPVRGACKIYFQHFDEADKRHFIDLMNEGMIRCYVMPFFATVRKE